MANTKPKLGARIFLGILGGLVGYILMFLMADMGVFPSLAWANIGLFVGVIFGAFHSELEAAFDN